MSSTISRLSPARPKRSCRSPCTYDFEVAAAKYLHSLEQGEIPLLLMFSGTVFAKGEHRTESEPGSVEQGSELPAPGARLARVDRSLFSQQRMAAPATRDAHRT